MTKELELFEKHWTKSTGRPLDEMTINHMQYAIDAIKEALEISNKNKYISQIDIFGDDFQKKLKDYAKNVAVEMFEEAKEKYFEVTEPENKCKNFEYVKYSTTGAPNTIIILFKGDEKVTEINNDGPIKRITIRREFESYLIKQNGDVYYVDDLFVDASNYDTINKLVKEYEAKFDKNRGGSDCERGRINNEELLYKGRTFCEIVDNAYILGDIREVSTRYFVLVDQCNHDILRFRTDENGAFIDESSNTQEVKLDKNATYKLMILVAKYLENKNK